MQNVKPLTKVEAQKIFDSALADIAIWTGKATVIKKHIYDLCINKSNYTIIGYDTTDKILQEFFASCNEHAHRNTLNNYKNVVLLEIFLGIEHGKVSTDSLVTLRQDTTPENRKIIYKLALKKFTREQPYPTKDIFIATKEEYRVLMLYGKFVDGVYIKNTRKVNIDSISQGTKGPVTNPISQGTKGPVTNPVSQDTKCPGTNPVPHIIKMYDGCEEIEFDEDDEDLNDFDWSYGDKDDYRDILVDYNVIFESPDDSFEYDFEFPDDDNAIDKDIIATNSKNINLIKIISGITNAENMLWMSESLSIKYQKELLKLLFAEKCDRRTEKVTMNKIVVEACRNMTYDQFNQFRFQLKRNYEKKMAIIKASKKS